MDLPNNVNVSLTPSSPSKAHKSLLPPPLAISVSYLTLTYSFMITSHLSVNPPSFSFACFETFATVLIFTLLPYWQTHLSPQNLIIAIPSYMTSLNPLYIVFRESKTHQLVLSSLQLGAQTTSLLFSNDSTGFPLLSA